MNTILTVQESIQHSVIVQFLNGHVSKTEACDRLKIHRTTFERKLARYLSSGPVALAHGLRHKPSNHALDHSIRRSICDLFTKSFKPFGYGVAHFYEEASSLFPQPVGYSTVIRWFKEEGLTCKVHKGTRHHSRRPRREAFGEMLQMDTSIHDWLGWNKNIALVSAIDDATSHLCSAYLTFTDTTLANMTVLEQIIKSYGLFASLYVDRSPIFKVTRTGGPFRINHPRFNTDYTTQVQRALEELGIELIYAYSPQAKGRVERSYGTLQKRLVPEFKKNGILDLDKANLYLKEHFIPHFNHRFAKDPKSYPTAFVPLYKTNLDYILAEKHHFTISNDHIISSKLANLKLKILPSQYRSSFARCKVDVFKHTSGKISVLYNNQPLNFTNLNPS